MRHRYFEFNGRKFAFQHDLGLANALFDFVLTYGDEALQALRQMEGDPEQSQQLQELLESGLLEKVKGRFRLTPRAVNAMQRKALMEIFTQLQRGSRDSHAANDRGGPGERVEGTRTYEFGDPISELDLAATLRNTLQRQAAAGKPATSAGRVPLRIGASDLELHETEARASCSTVVLLDMSGSMQRFNRFVQAKKCAMALMALIRQRFPLDTVDLVGFYSGAETIGPERLPLLMPKRVTLFDPEIRLRVPIGKLDAAPPHFTNLHMGLLQARRLLARRGGDNQMVFIITDGQPTAHVRGDYVYLIYPPDETSHVATLKEALLIAQRGVRVCTFALTDDYWDMDWLGFVDQLGKLTRGVTFHCTSGDLTACVMHSYLSGRQRTAYLA